LRTISTAKKISNSENVNDLFRRYIKIMTLFEGIFSLVKARCGTLTDAQLDRSDRLIKCIMKEWRALQLSMGKPNDPPRVHVYSRIIY